MFLKIRNALLDPREIAYVSHRSVVLKGGYCFTGEPGEYENIVKYMASTLGVEATISIPSQPDPETANSP